MKERIENKINAYIYSILAKEEINHCDYMTLSAELCRINNEESMKRSSENMMRMMQTVFDK